MCMKACSSTWCTPRIETVPCAAPLLRTGTWNIVEVVRRRIIGRLLSDLPNGILYCAERHCRTPKGVNPHRGGLVNYDRMYRHLMFDREVFAPPPEVTSYEELAECRAAELLEDQA